MNWYAKVLKQYFVIDGRAQRAEYWYFILFNILISIGCLAIDNLLGTTFNDGKGGILLVVYQLFILIPSFTVSIRRLHDTNHSGWWLLIGIIPIIGAIVLFVFYVLDSDEGSNKFGPNPKLDVN